MPKRTAAMLVEDICTRPEWQFEDDQSEVAVIVVKLPGQSQAKLVKWIVKQETGLGQDKVIKKGPKPWIVHPNSSGKNAKLNGNPKKGKQTIRSQNWKKSSSSNNQNAEKQDSKQKELEVKAAEPKTETAYGQEKKSNKKRRSKKSGGKKQAEHEAAGSKVGENKPTGEENVKAAEENRETSHKETKNSNKEKRYGKNGGNKKPVGNQTTESKVGQANSAREDVFGRKVPESKQHNVVKQEIEHSNEMGATLWDPFATFNTTRIHENFYNHLVAELNAGLDHGEADHIVAQAPTAADIDLLSFDEPNVYVNSNNEKLTANIAKYGTMDSLGNVYGSPCAYLDNHGQARQDLLTGDTWEEDPDIVDVFDLLKKMIDAFNASKGYLALKSAWGAFNVRQRPASQATEVDGSVNFANQASTAAAMTENLADTELIPGF